MKGGVGDELTPMIVSSRPSRASPKVVSVPTVPARQAKTTPSCETIAP